MKHIEQVQMDLIKLGGDDMLMRKRLSTWFSNNVKILANRYISDIPEGTQDPVFAKNKLRSEMVSQLVAHCWANGLIKIETVMGDDGHEYETISIGAIESTPIPKPEAHA